MDSNPNVLEKPDYPYPVYTNSRKKKWIALISFSIVAIIGVGLFLYRQPKKAEVVTVVTAAVEYKQLSTSPTSKPKISRMDVSVQVLNGSGTTGQAGLVVKALENAGYNPNNIKSGNAEKMDYKQTSITSRADFKEIVMDIKKILLSQFPEIIDGIENTNPNEDAGYDVIIITGSAKAQESTPEADIR